MLRQETQKMGKAFGEAAIRALCVPLIVTPSLPWFLSYGL